MRRQPDLKPCATSICVVAALALTPAIRLRCPDLIPTHSTRALDRLRPGERATLLVYLNAGTWTGEKCNGFTSHLQRALDDGLEIVVVHEQDPLKVCTTCKRPVRCAPPLFRMRI